MKEFFSPLERVNLTIIDQSCDVADEIVLNNSVLNDLRLLKIQDNCNIDKVSGE